MKKKSKPKRKPETKLADLVAAARAAGAQISVALEPNMPKRCANDPPPVVLLLDESERLTRLGNNWLNCENPNPIAADKVMQMGWAHALSAAWLRAKLDGSIDKAK